MTNLMETVTLMASENYEDRFRAEYYQLKIRYNKLLRVLANYNYKDYKCSKKPSQDQANAMRYYLLVLKCRSYDEGIEL